MIEANKENLVITNLFFYFQLYFDMKKQLDFFFYNKTTRKKERFLLSRFLGEEETGRRPRKTLTRRERENRVSFSVLGEATFVDTMKTTTLDLKSKQKHFWKHHKSPGR